jgi:hypothetical protein
MHLASIARNFPHRLIRIYIAASMIHVLGCAISLQMPEEHQRTRQWISARRKSSRHFPVIEEADERFTSWQATFTKLAPILAEFNHQFGVCLVHAHCELKQGKKKIAKGNITQPEMATDIIHILNAGFPMVSHSSLQQPQRLPLPPSSSMSCRRLPVRMACWAFTTKLVMRRK